MKTTTEWLEELDGKTLYSRKTESHDIVSEIQNDAMKNAPDGFQIVSNKAIAWLHAHAPDAYYEFYQRINIPLNQGPFCSVCSSEEHKDGDCLK